MCPYLREAALAPDAAPYPYSDARRPPPGADPYGQPFPAPQGAVRPPSATLHSAAPPPQSADPDADAGPPPSDAGSPPPYSDAAPPSQGAAPYGDARTMMTRGLCPRGLKARRLLARSGTNQNVVPALWPGDGSWTRPRRWETSNSCAQCSLTSIGKEQAARFVDGREELGRRRKAQSSISVREKQPADPPVSKRPTQPSLRQRGFFRYRVANTED